MDNNIVIYSVEDLSDFIKDNMNKRFVITNCTPDMDDVLFPIFNIVISD